ncbi:MAG TPA: HAMP domain-containing sensor histidine kinase [Acetobacteraceae bacterium]|nr:HAMP domain-containing sensor histidine kinase [Acetobacteraceae bacterium]
MGRARGKDKPDNVQDRLTALEARVAELTDALRSRDEFIAMAAHELRNPLLPISVQIELLMKLARQTPAEAGFISGLERLDRAVATLLKRSVALLDVSRITAGRYHLDLADVDLAALVRQIVTVVTPLADRAGARLQLTAPHGVSGRWDRVALEQIVENLIANAIKYGDGSQITVALTSNGAVARLSVRDEGSGISAADQARIFGRFERAVMQHQHGGFGIGLWVSQQLIAAMHGTISVESRAGAGSEFIVTLPTQQESADGHRT